jgi:bifunctional DNA-binding transcriptional regulator/antitoxin component of YhaV-PrlF toxin-antitoxin module
MEKVMAVVDKQRRIYIPRQFKERVGSRFFVVKMGDEIRLVPVPDDPAKDLGVMGSKLPKKSIKQLKKEILAEAQRGL